ncbi:MAG TPA: serine hydrolase [Oleiagrimonas sp.]|nr:serine hydrolase [Oleiagrimonas sp.]
MKRTHGWLRAWRLHGLVLGVAVLAASAPAAATPPQDLDAFAARAMDTFHAPGMAVAIVEGDKAYTRVYGVKELGKPDAVDVHTTFPIGSNTKAFTATALAILVDNGKLRWDDLVIDKLPGFRMYDTYATRHMTIVDMLCHRSGLGPGEGDLMFLPSSTRTRAELVHSIRYLKPATSFRAGYAYDNVLYAVAGQVVQAVSGQRWEDFVRERIFALLGMHDATVSLSRRGPDRVALHGKVSGPLRGMGPQSVLSTVLSGATDAPAGAISASATDMTHWLRVQLSRGRLPDGGRLFSAASARQLWTPETLMPIHAQPEPLALTEPNFQAYALGQIVRDYRGHKIVRHTGGVLGAYSIVGIIPGKQVAFAVMINAEDLGTLMATYYHLMDHYLGLSSPDWIARYQKVLAKRHAAALETLREAHAQTHPERGPSLPLSGYVGVYRDPWYGTVTITMGKDGQLRLSMDRTPAMHGPIEHVQYDTFRTHWVTPGLENAYVTFALNPDGSIDQASMHAVSPLADFSYDYRDLHLRPEPTSTATAEASP